MSKPILTLTITQEKDVVGARQRARQIAALVGFPEQDQIRIATAVSEIARNSYVYAGSGKIEFALSDDKRTLVTTISDRGPGIPSLDRILSGEYRSATGLGLGIVGAQRLMDGFTIESKPGEGTSARLTKQLPQRSKPVDIAKLSAELARPSEDGFTEMQQHNRELLTALDELRRKQDEMQQLNRELEETNRGVLALSAELEEKAEHLRRAGELKSRFLSHASHEFRTPLNGIIGLTRLLLNRKDPRPEEEVKQITYIQRSALELTELVNDLLDLAKVEAGKISLHSSEFDPRSLLGALRGMFRPLQTNEAVNLIFEEPDDLPMMWTDESKVAQIIRNFISNALKFTERGEVRVRASYFPASDSMVFSVSDSGIGIALADQEKIFQEFAQIDSPVQRRVKGTGLGLPLCRKLAELLGGTVQVNSEAGKGATFSATVRRVLAGPMSHSGSPAKVLLIDDEEISRYLIQQLIGEGHEFSQASDGRAGLELAHSLHPDLILLDLEMPGMDGFQTLQTLRSDPEIGKTPVAIVTARSLSPTEREQLEQNTLAVISKGALARAEALVIDPGPPLSLSLRPSSEPLGSALP